MTTSAVPIEIASVGIVAGAGDDVARVDWSRVRSEIRVHDEYADALLGLSDYSHLLVIGWLDRIPNDLRLRLRAHPSGDERYPVQGALALRGGARPNPISVTVCRLLRIDGTRIRVEGLDLVDGTPVLDLKPYIAHYDSVPGASLPGWASG
ncbi:MAG: tRNA (N6-threonylcarbamoyladenosine(37)-N6)-methyltransferase TrmO [Chloroflexi bacterium]|nr:tRNA (N6-threonylcarbamoyladenosine(37)-N6)-methyltransferase TrmO [Chloroflexota bacterium]MDA1002818.1 tRNA (N6-threonylcarbamoyladenosine(37)-N6)-methyltransferase TrmO [Chloroflexota bacterium]MQC27638.1 tRNA (N6-threonylcarbamoyladenosine(37)-N6)-methyltransferase TrmO [Chloroflexota bacterium]